MKKDWTGGSRLLLKILYMIPEDRPLVAIGYRYDTQKFLSFINAEYEGSTKAGITYSSNHPYLFANVAILPVNPPLVISKLVGYVNDIKSHNKSRQYNLALEYPVWLAMVMYNN